MRTIPLSIKSSLILCLLAMALPWQAHSALIIAQSSTWNYFKGTQEASSPTDAWRAVGFDDSGWLTGQAPMWYENSSGYTGNTQLTDMFGNYSTVFLRQSFNVTDPSSVGSLIINMRCDDGCVVWINGTEVASLGRPGNPLTFLSTAANGNDEPKTGSPTVNDTSFLVAGANVVAVMALNVSIGASSDFLFDLSITSTEPDFDPPVILSVDPTPGEINALPDVTVVFSEPVAGVNASDLLLNGFPAGNVLGGPTTYTFTFPSPPFGTVSFEWAPNPGIVDFAFPANTFDAAAPGATWEYQLVDNVVPTVTRINPPAGLTVRALNQIDIQFSESVIGVDAADLLINGSPATSLTVLPSGLFSFQFPEPPTGSVQVAWSPTASITDQAAEPNVFAGGNWLYTLDPNAPPPDLVLNEIMAANITGLTDEFGENEDWIEIWNRSSIPIDLAGWSLTDDLDVKDKWVFPSVLLGPDEYLVVFASAKDIKAPTGNNRFHTNFKLGVLGEEIGLFSPDAPRQAAQGITMDFPEQRNDHSYGLDSGGNLRYFAAPTPGGPNGDSPISGVVEPVHFSVSRGYFNAPFTLSLATDTRGAVIYYTTDGSVPTPANGTRYLAPITISQTTLLRAIATRINFLPSKVGTHTYLFDLSPALRSLPIISIVTDTNHIYGPTGIIGIKGGSGPPNNEWNATDPNDPEQYHNPKASLSNGPAWERPTSVEWIEQDNSGFQVDAGIRVHGSGWTRPRYTFNDKFAFRLYFRGDYGPSRLNFPWFPGSVDDSLDEVVLRAGHNDVRNPFIVDELIRQLHADMGQAASHGTFGNLILNGVPVTFRTESGNFYFNPVNRVKEGFLQAWHGGGTSWDIIGPFGESQGGGDRVSFNALESFIRNNDMSQQANYEEARSRLDMVNFVDYVLVNVYGATWDWPHNNWRAARERVPNGIWRFYVWDAEGAFYTAGRTPTYNNFTDNSQGLADTEEIATFYKNLRTNPEFRLLWADRIQKHFFNNGALVEENIENHFLRMRAILSGVFAMNNNILNDWIPRRRAVIFPQFATQGLLAPIDAPTLNPHGGSFSPGVSVTLSAPLGTIYYTTDGSDPRIMFSGAVAGSATAYSPGNPIVLNQSTTIKARALDGADWSALIEADFEVGALGLPLRITEIMYHPSGNNDAHEYIEIQHVGTSPLNVSGLAFTGIDYTFPDPTILAPGQIFLLGSDNDPLAFADRYPGVQVDGTFGGNLRNSGERLEIRDVLGNILYAVEYNDGGGWPSSADGRGRSLEIIDPFGAEDEPANWRASLSLNGSPGTANASQPSPNVVLNEVMADNLGSVSNGPTFPDWVELRNLSGQLVDLSGWSLTDNGDPRQFVFPQGTSIDANGYLVVWCDDATNSTPGLHAGFALNRNEESLFLYDPNTNRVDAVSFGHQISDRTIGRINGIWTLNSQTLAAPNSALALAPASSLSINEWLANPFSGEDDWIELYNKSASQPVSLKNIYLQANASIHQLTSLAFLEPNGFIQLFADENSGPNHLDFKLPANGATLWLYDSVATEIESTTYSVQAEGVSRGRFPDGSVSLRSFVGSASPGAPNYILNYAGPFLNEVMARNQTGAVTPAGNTADWVEMFNPSGTAFDLSGMSLSVNDVDPGEWVFPPGTMIPGNSYLQIWCDDSQPASTNAGAFLNTGQSLNGSSGGVYLFNQSLQLVNSVEYGFQVEDLSIGRVGGFWRLLQSPSPAAINTPAIPLGPPTTLVFNEWMANPDGDNDWFEIYNTGTQPVDLNGLFVTDDPSESGMTNHVLGALSYIGAEGWIQVQATGNPERGRNHTSFSLNGQGESLLLYNTDGTLIDSVYFDAQQDGTSEGRLPDGAASITRFMETPTPDRSNYLPSEIVIHELLTHTDDPLEDAIELFNPSASAVNLSGWFLSDNRRNLKKFTFPNNTILAGNSHMVVYENQFNDGSPNAFALSSARGGTVWLSESTAGGNLTGKRARAGFEASENGVSIGRIVTSVATEYVALSQRTFGMDNPASLAEFRTGTGAPNAGPNVGPIVINEIMYHPPDLLIDGNLEDNSRDEYIELFNAGTETVLLYDATFPDNTWSLRDAVFYNFPSGTSMDAGDYLLVVGFDPIAEPLVLAEFRSANGVDAGVPIVGPYSGKLDNSGETIKLFKPDTPQMPPAPDAGFVPQILADQVQYKDNPPWPTGDVDGGGLSLQKLAPTLYGNEPINLVADQPTPGRANGPGIVAPPTILDQPVNQSAFPGTLVKFGVTASGVGPFTYQWRFNGKRMRNETNVTLTIDFTIIPDDGNYDVIVSNAGGAAVSDPARLQITAPPIITVAPLDQEIADGEDVTFTAAAIGPGPLTYQWYFNGNLIPGATFPSLTLPGLVLEDTGIYEVRVTNPNATVSASANLLVLLGPIILIHPLSQSVVEGEDITFSVMSRGTLPMGYRWRQGSFTLANEVINSPQSFFTLSNVGPDDTGSTKTISVVLTNKANFRPGRLSQRATVTILADTDGDRIPDDYESANGLNPNDPNDANTDGDGDGMTALEEFRAGTDDNDPNSYLKIDTISVDGSGAALTFNAVSNRTYSIQYRGDFAGAMWQTLIDIPARGETQEVEVIDTDAPAPNARFYQLVTPKQ